MSAAGCHCFDLATFTRSVFTKNNAFRCNIMVAILKYPPFWTKKGKNGQVRYVHAIIMLHKSYWFKFKTFTQHRTAFFMPNTDFECKIKATISKTATILNKWEISLGSIAQIYLVSSNEHLYQFWCFYHKLHKFSQNMSEICRFLAVRTWAKSGK